MSANTKIEWATHTFNPWEGCQKCGPGCDHCYAESRNARFAGGAAINWGPGAPRRRTSAANWAKPKAWNANHEAFFATHGHRQRVFCASLGDVFDNEVDPMWRSELFILISETPNLDWLLLTKRIGNVTKMLPVWYQDPDAWAQKNGIAHPNVWIGATIVNQEEANRDITKLLAVPAAKRFLSMEPLLSPVAIWPYTMPHCERHCGPLDTDGKCGVCEGRGIWSIGETLNNADKAPIRPGLDWVIVGGESGPGARPMHPDWARSLRDQCEVAGVPFLFKQWGEWSPDYQAHTGMCVVMTDGEVLRPPNCLSRPDDDGEIMLKVGKKAAGRLLDGREWNGAPT